MHHSYRHGYHVSVIGGGQLARMMQEAANALGIELSALVEDDKGSTAQVVPHSLLGSPDDLQAIKKLCSHADVLTCEHEHIPSDVLLKMEKILPVEPRSDALLYAQDKIAMRQRLTEIGIPCPRWRVVTTRRELEKAGEDFHWPVIVKTPRGGYDGHGVLRCTCADDARDWCDGKTPLLVEECVAFTREIAVLLARRRSGEIRHWDVCETRQENGMCAQVIAPAPHLDVMLAQKAQSIGTRIAESLHVTGVLAVEMFTLEPSSHDESTQPALFVNELAMRPHNSGHWTIDGSRTSQFEQHLRAVLDLPLGETERLAPYTVMINIIGDKEGTDVRSSYATMMKYFPSVKLHYYGKSLRPGRKLGHFCLSGRDADRVYEQAVAAHTLLFSPSSHKKSTD